MAALPLSSTLVGDSERAKLAYGVVRVGASAVLQDANDVM